MVDPLTRNRTQRFAVLNGCAPEIVRMSELAPFTDLFIVTVVELDENSMPYPLRGRYALSQPPEPRRFTVKYADGPVAVQRYENSASACARAASPLSCDRAYAPDVLVTVRRPAFASL